MARKLNPQPPATYTLPRYFELLDSYQRSLAAGNLSKRTIETYSHSARDFGLFLSREGLLLDPASYTVGTCC